MTKYRVTFEIDEEVEADNRDDAIDAAISNIIGGGVWFENELTEYIRNYARIEEIYWSGATGYETKEIAQYGLCDEYHRIATINVKEVLNQQLEIEQLKQRIEFAKQAIDLFFKTEDESKLLEIAEWD